MSNERPDDATGDSVILVRVHAFLASLVTFLGFKSLPSDTIAGMLDTLTWWLDSAKSIRRDSQGVTARMWWDIFKSALLESRGQSDHAAQIADKAVEEFGMRFLPVVDEGERDTLDTGDLDALRAELDEADRYRNEISNALDGNPGERSFTDALAIDELRSERDALLASNKHHAVANIALHDKTTTVLDAIDSALCGACGWPQDATFNRFDAIARLRDVREERDALKAQLANAIIPLPKPERVEPGQRWAFVMTSIEPKSHPMKQFVDASGCGYAAYDADIQTAYYLGTEK